MTKIPKIIHQIWIGPKQMPKNLMDTWKEKNPDFEYICWTEEEMVKRNMEYVCFNQINDIEEIAGKVDIMRLEILYKYGGIYIDADSICIEPLDDLLLMNDGFACYENEQIRQELISNGTMGFIPQYDMCKDAIQWILNNNVSFRLTGKRAWQTVGPTLITKLYEYNKSKYTGFKIFPSFFFLPTHYSGLKYEGHKKVYAYQEWGSTNKSYDTMNDKTLPIEFTYPVNEISLLVSSYNTNPHYISDCLESIRNQIGYFSIEVVWVNDGSDEEHTKNLEYQLKYFIDHSRFIRLVYHRLEKNLGISKALNIGLSLCTNEIIVKMDSDDIMFNNRIASQVNFLLAHNDCVVCGTDLIYFKTNETNNQRYIENEKTKHPARLTWEEYKLTRQQWIMNHPTLCYKKSAVLAVGGYNENLKLGEDFDLEIKLLRKFGVIYNIPKIYLYYRIHPNQITYNEKTNTYLCKAQRAKFVNDMIKNYI